MSDSMLRQDIIGELAFEPSIDVTDTKVAPDAFQPSVTRRTATVAPVDGVQVQAGRSRKCSLCGDTIPMERLVAVPFTVYCARCAAYLDRGERDFDAGKRHRRRPTAVKPLGNTSASENK